MSRYIDADKLAPIFEACWDDNAWWFSAQLEEAKTENVKLVVHAKWIDNGIEESMLSKCSECGFLCGAYSFNYCPNCGVKMDLED